MMNAKVVSEIARSRYGLLVLGFFVCFTATGAGYRQTKELNAQDKAKVRERIVTIMRETLKRGEFTTAEGWKTLTRVPPEKRDTEEIQRYGDDAVPVLEEYLSSDVGREYELAMRFLGELGGSRIVEPLRRVILFNISPRKREYALRWITQAPQDEALPIIRRAVESDSDPTVRKVAREILTGYVPK